MCAMTTETPVKYSSAFTMRVDAEFLAALDELCEAQRPKSNRADMIRRLVFDESAKAKRRADRRKEGT